MRQTEDIVPVTDAAKKFSFFIKREMAPSFVFGTNDRPAGNPRIICAPNDQVHVNIGLFTRPATDALHEHWNDDYYLTYAGGMNPRGLDVWLAKALKRTAATQFVETDYSRFDVTYSNELLTEIVLQVYTAWGVPNDLIGWFLSIRKPMGKTSHGHRVKARPMMASGRDDTALMNALVNGIAQSYVWAAVMFDLPSVTAVTLKHLSAVRNCLAIVLLGDDSLTLMPPFKIERAEQLFLEFGLVVKVKVHDDIRKATFLGMRPYPVEGGGLAWGPTIGRRLYKHHYAADIVVDHNAWLRGVLRGELVSAAHVPVLSEINDVVRDIVGAGPTTPVDRLFKADTTPWLREKPLKPMKDAWGQYMSDVYGWTWADISDFEEVLVSMKSVAKLPMWVHTDGLRKCFELDN